MQQKAVAPSTRGVFLGKEKTHEKTMANPNPPLQAPKESFARGYKYVWRLLLISNLALGAYIFSRPRKNDTVKKDKKAMTKVPIAPPDITTSFKSGPEEATIFGPIPDSAKMNEPISENQ